MGMTKTEKNKIKKLIKGKLGEDYSTTQDPLIDEYVQWLEISAKSDNELETSVNTGNVVKRIDNNVNGNETYCVHCKGLR